MKKMTGDNRGLSLIELLVAIAVLGIVCIPLINAFINSAKINRNAERVHSASTLAQSIMEEYKATNLSVLLADVSAGSVSESYYNSLTPAQQAIVSANQDAFIPYVFYETGITAANGHVYDARITMNPMPYSNFDLTVSNASNTNTAQIPELPQVDNVKSAVIGNQVTAQDKKVLPSGGNSYSAEKKILALFGEFTSAELSTAGIQKTDMNDTLAAISGGLKKEIVVTIDNNASYVPSGSVLVTCDVIYRYTYQPGQTALIPNPSVTVNAYQAYYSVATTPASDDASDLDLEGRMAAYLFWTPSPYNSGNDKIVIENKTPYRIDMYLVKQDSATGAFRTIFVGDGTSQTEFKPDTEAGHKDGRLCQYNINLISNLGADYSKLYEQNSRLRCYEVTVEIFEGNGVDVYDPASTAQVTTMTSTKEVYQ